jgi:DNA-binding beta-propeller fold protein YncE
MQFDASGDLLAVNADVNESSSTLETFELPNSSPMTFSLTPGGWPWGMAINRADNHVFVADAENNNASEYSYPSGTLVGSVFGNLAGLATGIAVDR